MAQGQDVKKRSGRKNQGKTLGLLRKGLGIKQEDFGKLFGLSQSRVCDLEVMEKLPEKELNEFADYFKVPVEFFDRFNFKDVMENLTNYVDVRDSDQVTTANIIEEQNNYTESIQYYKSVDARIRDAKTIGRLEKEIETLKKALDQAIQ
ncbi:helix-turn-helix domain-containing protein [Dysgonomonas sp. 520]|uniref:helix-turn-helix domain-containing protein n=1 Tax=Dysgonomonas sp. 520 TaxID=2302931 RepID=UPI0013D76993|nr:helix-turn-helix transcriptional regulator [Dysgonomonas sp. 520]NDW10409.1 XRE family transcriptional regulator [Dysgonomonas sp. 520]